MTPALIKQRICDEHISWGRGTVNSKWRIYEPVSYHIHWAIFCYAHPQRRT